MVQVAAIVTLRGLELVRCYSYFVKNEVKQALAQQKGRESGVGKGKGEDLLAGGCRHTYSAVVRGL